MINKIQVIENTKTSTFFAVAHSTKHGRCEQQGSTQDEALLKLETFVASNWNESIEQALQGQPTPTKESTMLHFTHTSTNNIHFEVFAHPRADGQGWKVDIHFGGHVAAQTWEEEPTKETIIPELDEIAKVADSMLGKNK